MLVGGTPLVWGVDAMCAGVRWWIATVKPRGASEVWFQRSRRFIDYTCARFVLRASMSGMSQRFESHFETRKGYLVNLGFNSSKVVLNS